jgi:hypothetical protein
MQDHTVREYLEARKRYDEVAAHARQVIGVVLEAAHNLSRDPMRFMFANTSPDAKGMPPEVALSVTGLNAKDWPTAETIHNALASIHEATSKLRHAWDSVPAEERNSLKPPPNSFTLKSRG